MADCLCTIASIEDCLENDRNAAGLDRRLFVGCEDEILSIPAPATGTHKVTTDIAMRAAAVGPPAVAAGKFKTWKFSSEDHGWVSKRDAKTGTWTTEVKIFIPQLHDEKTYVFNGAGSENKIVIVADNNGKSRIVGSKNNGCTINADEQTNPKNGYNVLISWMSPQAPLFYTGAKAV